MEYELVLITYEERIFILLKHRDLFEKLIEFLDPCIVESTNMGVSMSEYRFIIQTLGNHVISGRSRKGLLCDFKCILEFKKLSDHYSESDVGVEKEFKLCPVEDRVTYLCYHTISKKSFLTKWGKQLCQFYGDFQFIDSIDSVLEADANHFFQGKMWNDKQNLLRKFVAFKNLFE